LIPVKEGESAWAWEEGVTEDIYVRWIDPSAFGHHETGELKLGALLAAEYGMVTSPARNDVESGIELVRRAFMSGMDNVPRLRVFSSLVNLRRELRNYRRATNLRRNINSNERRDAPVKADDHACDCLRYIAAGGLDFVKRDAERAAMERLDREVESLQHDTAMNALHRRHAIAWRNRARFGMPNPQHPGGLGDDW
jgi:hypothetical protein